METECIRCKNKFQNSCHSMAHFYVICFDCRKKSKETIAEQQLYNMQNYYGSYLKKYLEFKQ